MRVFFVCLFGVFFFLFGFGFLFFGVFFLQICSDWSQHSAVSPLTWSFGVIIYLLSISAGSSKTSKSSWGNTSQRQGLFLWFLSFSGSSICNILLRFSMGSQGEGFVYLSFPLLPKIEANIKFAKTLFSYILCLIKI